MANKEPNKKKKGNINNQIKTVATIDIIKELTDFVSYLKINDDCQMILKPSETE